MKSLRVVFMGTPEFAVASLEALHQSNHQVVGVVTVADKPAGRGLQMQMSAVKQFAVEHAIPVLQPLKLRDPDFIEALKALNADLFVIVAFRMLPEVVWQMPPLGSINLLGSLVCSAEGGWPGVRPGSRVTFLVSPRKVTSRCRPCPFAPCHALRDKGCPALLEMSGGLANLGPLGPKPCEPDTPGHFCAARLSLRGPC